MTLPRVATHGVPPSIRNITVAIGPWDYDDIPIFGVNSPLRCLVAAGAPYLRLAREASPSNESSA